MFLIFGIFAGEKQKKKKNQMCIRVNFGQSLAFTALLAAFFTPQFYRLYQPRALFTGYTYPDPNDPGYCVDNYIGLHHYTTNVYEIEQMVNNGWDYEQVAFLDKGERWLYRVYNPNDGNHLFTLNSHEKDELTALGWHDEGVGWRVSLSGKPVYRIYNPGSGEHIYTLNYEEVKAAVAAGMHDEGIAWWS
jgi:hypothetical protein